MEADAPGLWLLPTRGRVCTKLPRFLEAAHAAGTSTRGLLIIDFDDYRNNHEYYDALKLPHGWSACITPPESVCSSMGYKIRYALGLIAAFSYHWVGWLSDDMVPVTPGWDVKILEQLNGWNFVTTDDQHLSPRRVAGAVAWSMDLVRAIGYLMLPGAEHMFADDMWQEIGERAGCWTYQADVLVRHAHHTLERSADDTSRSAESSFAADEQAYGRWRDVDMMPAVERVIALKRQMGVPMVQPDLADISLMVATPAGDGKFDRVFLSSWEGTIAMLRTYGATVRRLDIPYCSDIVLARAKLLGAFRRSTCTHLLMIDSDMGWRPEAVVRLLLYKRDFVSVAGLRKTHPTRACVNNSDEDGNILPLQVDPADQDLVRVTHVGMAFTLLSRVCVERMCQHYADLTYRMPNCADDVCAFMPMIINGRYLAEDFAFCERWRRIGGAVWVDAAVALDHVGSHVWSGSWLELLRQEIAQEQKTA